MTTNLVGKSKNAIPKKWFAKYNWIGMIYKYNPTRRRRQSTNGKVAANYEPFMLVDCWHYQCQPILNMNFFLGLFFCVTNEIDKNEDT